MIRVTRREFSLICRVLASAGVVNGAILSLFNIEAQAQSQVEPPDGTRKSVSQILSDYVQRQTSILNEFTTLISQGALTINAGANVQLDIASISYSASGGIAASYNFKTGDYILPTAYGAIAPALAAGGITMSASLGAAAGLGDFSGFEGNSSVASLSVGQHTFSLSMNDNFMSLGYARSFGASSSTLTDQSDTQITTPPRGNVYYDIQSIEHTLLNLSQDPLSNASDPHFGY